MRATIIKGENKGKSGEIIGMFFGAGICIIKTDDDNEYAVKPDEIQKIYSPIKSTIIGLPKEMVEEIENREGISMCRNGGDIYFSDNKEYREYGYIECEELFLDILRKEYKIELPSDYSEITLFAAEGKQKFNFYVGLMF